MGSLAAVIRELRNLFLEETNDLLRLDTRDVMDLAVCDVIQRAHEIGKKQYQSFKTDRFVTRSKSMKSDPIHKNKLFLCSNSHT